MPISNSEKHRPWLQHYPTGVDWRREFEPLSLPDMFDQACERYRERVCTNFLDRTLSYGQIQRMTNRFTAGLQNHELGRGHRIGLFLPNCPYYIAAYFAVLKTGACVVNFNPLYTVSELTVQARDAGIIAMVTLDLKVVYDKAFALLDSGVIENLIVCPFTDLLPLIKSMAFKLTRARQIANIARKPRRGKVLHWDQLTASGETYSRPIIHPQNDIALLQYTGGTTGTPKGAMLSHANLTINVQQTLAWAQTLNLDNERFMAVLPFFHVFAMTVVMNTAIRTGSAMILMPKFDLGEAVKLIKQHKPTVFPAVPTLYSAILNHKSIKKSDLSGLRLCLSGGAALPKPLRESFENKFGCRLVEGYGLSETSPVATANPVSGPQTDGSIGQPVPATTIAIRSLNDSSVDVEPGEAGEICIHGPQVMAGYWNNAAETETAFTSDGYFRTGDVGQMDDAGFTIIIDRIKDMINCSGFKVYPRRIEDAIYGHGAVEEVTVIGIADAYRGEAPMAFIKLKAGQNATADEIMDFLRDKLSKIEIPAEIEFRDELPKTMIGKLSKKELRGNESPNSPPDP